MKKFQIKSLFELLKDKSIKKVKDFFLKSEEGNLFISSILRTFLRNKYLLRLYLNFMALNQFNEFLKIRIGYMRRMSYLSYFNIDPYLINNPQICLPLSKLPFEYESCQEIKVKYFFKYFQEKHIKKLLKNWNKVLIPGGFLKIEFKLKSNEKKFEFLKKKLLEQNFHIYKIENLNLKFNGTILIHSIKKKVVSKDKINFQFKKKQDILSILRENKDLYNKLEKIAVLGKNVQFVKDYLNELTQNANKIEIYNDIKQLSEISNSHFDFCIVTNFLEYQYNWSFEVIFTEIRCKLKPDSPILIIIPNKKCYYLKEYLQLFEKGIIMEQIDAQNIAIDWINLSTSLNMIQILLKNQFENPQPKNDMKVCLLGIYEIRYTHMNSATWDGQIRAFEKLGYNSLVLDAKDNSFDYILKRIIDFKPKILWIVGIWGLHFLMNKSKFFKNSKICIVFWWMDATLLFKYDFNQIIDYMFLSNKGQIPFYKENFNIKKIYYMPQFTTPQILHRNKFIKEKYEIGFSGLLNYSKYHIKRTLLIKKLQKKFNLKSVNNIYNNLPEFYSQCKIILGGAPDLDDIELYTSNRLFLALSCGTCFITNYFKGIEKLAEQEHHILWYKNEKQLEDLIKKYLSNEDIRFKIKKNAEELARLKHNSIIRTQNILDIINEKTEDFYSFIK